MHASFIANRIWRHPDFSARGRWHAARNFLIADSDPNFILVLHCNYTSIVHRFRFHELFMFAGNDVIVISSLGGASGNFWLRIPKRATPACFTTLRLIRNTRQSVGHSTSTSVTGRSSNIATSWLRLFDDGCMIYLQGSWIDSSRCSLLPLDSSTRPGEPSTCLRSSVSSTGFGSRSGIGGGGGGTCP